VKRKASISHEESMIRQLRDDPEFAAEYLKAAMEDSDEPKVLLIAIRLIQRAPAALHCTASPLTSEQVKQIWPHLRSTIWGKAAFLILLAEVWRSFR
jgi:hypothetical protein